jgi:hypothetical protein
MDVELRAAGSVPEQPLALGRELLGGEDARFEQRFELAQRVAAGGWGVERRLRTRRRRAGAAPDPGAPERFAHPGPEHRASSPHSRTSVAILIVATDWIGAAEPAHHAKRVIPRSSPPEADSVDQACPRRIHPIVVMRADPVSA